MYQGCKQLGYTLIVGGTIALVAYVALCFVLFTHAFGHEHTFGETTKESAVVEFLRKWHRPKGPYSIIHRQGSCCYVNGLSQDCFPVKEIRIIDGRKEVRPDLDKTMVDPETYNRWYEVPPSVEEKNQPDPYESPDARAYVCIAGSMVICYIEGAGV